VKLSGVPLFLRWIAWFSYARYAFQSILTGIYGFEREDLLCSKAYCHFKSPVKFLQQVDAAVVDIREQAACLFGIFLACRLMAYFALRWKILMEKR
jgi:hypothetical protein